ncbi:MAG: murein biosynthesis integral membrane protein MurJ [Candidatus Moranbacteria bacterium CG_4_9_14_3_um_filter_45_14]|nr:MAG: murein biosynthesis integral membrane protein MurJ [Candidatus Moranbacteria bacterium CG2_30_45_14]PJA85302.1 MAG: murein biosynthesis integral membrane protein MurJ [Candidatus Moranbacteria bacterium CG_4_9_14_3_um_filter_45_14]
MNKFLRFLPTGSIILAMTTFASYGAGLWRDRIFAQSFGASRSLDAYNAAFLLPDLLFNIFIASGIAAAFVPIISPLLKSDRKRAEEYLGTVITGAMGAMTLSALVIIVFAGQISALVAPGFAPEDQLLVTKLLRYLALSPIIFSASNALGALLIVERRFLYYGLSPVLYNLGIIFGTIFLSARFGIMGAVWGTLLGALLHLSVRLFDVLRSGFKLKWSFYPKRPEFKKTLSLMLPKMFGHPVELATFWAFTIVASHLEPGSVAILNFARNFESVPVSLIGITIATTTFPLLARSVADGTIESFRKALRTSFWLILGGSIFAAIVIFLIREPLIRIILGGGAFDQESVARTALVLGVFTLAMPTESLVHLLARAFYATKNTLIPVVLSIIGLVIAIGGAVYLTPRFGIVALPFSFFLASLTELILLLSLLPRRLRTVENTR